jgi:nitroreductase
MTIDVLNALMERRHSVRGFAPGDVPREVIDRALATAAQTPSWCNTQPWNVVVTSGEGTERFREALATAFASGAPEPDFAFPQTYAGIYRERRLETALQLYDAVGIERGDRAASGAQTAKNFRLFDAPHAAVVTTEADLGTYGAVDCGLFLNSLLLAFEALGVGAIPQAALAAYADVIREHFDLPDSRRLVAGISFGWEDADHPANTFRTHRADPASFTTYSDR